VSRHPVSSFPVSLLPETDDVVLAPDERTDERPTYVTPSDLDSALAPIRAAIADVLDHVGPTAQRHRARREAALLASVIVGIGCFGLGALDLQGASDLTIGILGGLILAAVVAVVAVLGRVHVTASAPGVSIGAGGSTSESTP
jgi:hypothetical protein